MLEKPALPDETLLAAIETAFDLPGPPRPASLAFLPLGADRNTAVYRLDRPGAAWFVKLRLGDFDEPFVTLPRYLSEHGIAEIIAPLRTRTGGLWAPVSGARLILYPFIEGRDAYQVELTDEHWRTFGAALRQIHTLPLPAALRRSLRVEDYASPWPAALRRHLQRFETERFADPLARQCAVFLTARRAALIQLLERAERYARTLRASPPETVLCHTDLHAGNLFIDAAGRLYIVDWDAPLLAPKERDLMYPGGGQFANRRTPAEEQRLFYGGYSRGYGPAQVNPQAIAYYRYARIIEDLTVECDLIVGGRAALPDRQRELGWLQSNFAPGGALEIARRADDP